MNEKKHPAISIIVPIYSVEKYLRQCLDSIVGQTLTDIEIILINDGSEDSSLVIIGEYAKKDGRIKVIDKPNEGYGKTMNRGLGVATGEYIGIVESDDWIEPNMYETLYEIAKTHDVEVVKSRFIPFDDGTGKDKRCSRWPECEAEQVFNPRQSPGIFFIQTSIWSAIYKREFLSDNGIRFLESQGASYQDIGFNFKVWAMADKVYLTKAQLVHYRIGHPSQSVKSKDKVFCVCDEFREIERYMASNPELFKELRTIFHQVKCGAYLWNFSRLEGENRQAFRKQIQTEILPLFENGVTNATMLPGKTRLKLLKIIYPNSIWLRIRYTLGTLTRWILKERQCNGVIETRIFFGKILIWKKTVSDKGIQQ